MTFKQRLRAEAALSSTYDRGRELALGGDVLACNAEPSAIAGTVRVTGSVRGSGGGAYQTAVTLDTADEDVVGYTCTCPAATKYDGMCKHEVALALAYLDGRMGTAGAGTGGAVRPATGRAGSGSPASPLAQRASSSKARAIPTDQRIRDLVGAITTRAVEESAAARRQRALLRQGADADPAELLVSIVPTAESFYGTASWCLKLRVRQGKASYVVKNVGELVDAWRCGAEVCYGKNLTLVHVPAAFTPASHALLDTVTRIVDSQQALFASRWKYLEAGRGTSVKDLPLAPADVIDMLDILQGSSFSFDPNANYYVSSLPVRQLEVTRGDPVLPAALAKASDGGYDLRFPAGACCFADGTRMYVLDEAHAWRCDEEFARTATGVLDVLLPTTRSLHVGPADLPAFCRTALPVLRACTRLDVPEKLDALMPPAARLTFKVGLDDGEVTCHATVAYGPWSASVYEPQRPGQPPRDLVAEYRAQEAVEEYFPAGDVGPADDPYFDEDDDGLLYTLLTDGLSELAGLGEVLLSERLRNVQVRESPQVRVKATVRGGLLDLAVDSSGLSAKDLAAYLASYKRKQRFMRLSNGDIVRLDGSMRALSDLADGLGVEVADLIGGAVGLPSNRTLFVDALLRKAENVRLERSASFRAIVRDFDTFSEADFEVPASLASTLRPYQADGFRWLETLERFGFGGILADDMGLGKTLQVIAHILARKDAAATGVGVAAGEKAGAEGAAGTTLVVCPASLVYNWMAELARFAPQLDAAAVVGGKAARSGLIAQAGAHDVLVTSYDLMKRDVDAYAERRFARVVLDEAHYIKNANTQVAKAARCLVANTRLALTGTPVENRLSELWSILDFLMPGVLGSAESFRKRFAGPVEAGEEGAARRLQCLVAPFILRRLKTDVLADLPEKSESVVLARMEGEQDLIYKAHQDRLALQVQHELPDLFKKKKLQVLAALTQLRQICCDPRLAFDDYAGGSAKLDTCMELVGNAVDGGHQVLVFSQFTSMLELISERLRAAKVGHLVLTGATGKEERARLVERFQAGEAPVFLTSLKAGGVGLNLTAADVVIHYDPWWNLAAQNQATDRAHRIGQERAVSVFKLICQGTIEERIVAMQERKRDLAESVLGGEASASGSLTREDVLALLGEAGAQG